MKEISVRHARMLRFGMIGGAGYVLSFVILTLGVEVFKLSSQVAYITQMVLVVEFNFLMSYYFVWGDRKQESWADAWRRFHLSRIGTIILNYLVYAGLVLAGTPYLAAHTGCIIAMTLVNWRLGDRFVFRLSSASLDSTIKSDNPPISVVVPVKGNHDTIRDTVESLLSQHYDGRIEVILVGDPDDSTWPAVRDYIDSGAIQALETDVVSPGRDANAKRSIGLSHASGELLAVIDSDMILPSDWANRVLNHFRNGHHAVAGSFIGIGDSFWTRYIDQNPTLAKTPRMKDIDVLNRTNLRWKKPPVTANFVCTRQVYEVAGGPNASFTNCYEDYEWFSRIVRGGFPIVCDPELSGSRYHREGFKPLMNEYIRSGKGCVDHMVTHFTCGFAQTRMLQLLVVVALMGSCLASVVQFPILTVTTAIVGYGLVALLTFMKVGRGESLIYPAIAAVFSVAFVYGCLTRFARQGIQRPVAPIIRWTRTVEMEKV